MTTLTTKLRIDDWAEEPVAEYDDGRRITRAQVQLRDGADGLESGAFSMLAYYRPDGTSDYVTLMHLSGALDGRSGTFVLRGDGGFDGSASTGEMTIVPGSGTGELEGISGRADSRSTHDDYPHMPLNLSYELP
jgi:hypothetical protein